MVVLNVTRLEYNKPEVVRGGCTCDGDMATIIATKLASAMIFACMKRCQETSGAMMP